MLLKSTDKPCTENDVDMNGSSTVSVVAMVRYVVWTCTIQCSEDMDEMW